MVSEFFAEGGSDVAVTLTPGESGILQVFIDGQKVFDKKEEGGKHVDLPRLKEMRTVIKDKLATPV